MARQLTVMTALEVASHEAVVRQAYLDSVGTWTWSVGLTSATGHIVERYIGKPQTMFRCLEIYVWALQRYAAQVEKAFEGYELTEEQFAAALSFHWNTGAIGRALWVEYWKSGKTAKAKEAFMNWDNPKSLTERREKERDLFFLGVWSNRGTVTEYTKLNKNSTPDFSSGRQVNITTTIETLILSPPAVKPDIESKPEVHSGKTLTPSEHTGKEIRIPVPAVVAGGLLLVAVAFILFFVALT